jgi:hypothetical protein
LIFATIDHAIQIRVIMRQIMKSVFTFVRKLARFVVAAIVWLHALFLMNVALPSAAPIARMVGMNSGEFIVISLIVALSVLAAYGVGQVVIDLLYIYFFPFVLCYLFARYMYLIGRGIHRYFKRNQAPLAVITAPTPISVPNSPPKQETKPDKNTWRSVARAFVRPFQLTSLWGVLILLTSKPLILKVALAVVIVNIIISTIYILGMGMVGREWLSQLEVRLRAYGDELIDAIRGWDSVTTGNTLRDAWNKIQALEIALRLLRKRERIAQLSILAGIALFLGVYLYVAFLMGFVYFGVARLRNVPWGAADSFVTSLFIFFGYADLPKDVWLKILGGIHCTFVLLLGARAIVSHLQKRLEAVYSVANTINDKLQAEEIRAKIAILDKQFKPKISTPS